MICNVITQKKKKKKTHSLKEHKRAESEQIVEKLEFPLELSH